MQPDWAARFRVHPTGQENIHKPSNWQVITRFLMKAPSSLVFKAQGRYWLSRSIFELGTLFEKEERYEDAREIYKLILDYDLPGLTLAEAKIQKFSSI